mgnify:CR=1 FL=1
MIGKDVIQFSVEDEGPGVPDALREKIFQPWVKLTEATVSGVGLGLAISMSVVQGLNGTIGCGDRADGAPGARFWFSVPFLTSLTGESFTDEDVAESQSEEEKNSNSPLLRDSSLMGAQRVTLKTSGPTQGEEARRDAAEEEDEDRDMKEWYTRQHILIVEDNVVNEKMLRALLKATLRVGGSKKGARKTKGNRDKERAEGRKKEKEKESSHKREKRERSTGERKSNSSSGCADQASVIGESIGEKGPLVSSCVNGLEALRFVVQEQGSVDVVCTTS